MTEIKTSVDLNEKTEAHKESMLYAIASETADGRQCTEKIWSRKPLNDHVASYRELIDSFNVLMVESMPVLQEALHRDLIIPVHDMPGSYNYLQFDDENVHAYRIVNNQYGTKANTADRGRIVDLEMPLYGGDEMYFAVQAPVAQDNIRTYLSEQEVVINELFAMCRSAASEVPPSQVVDHTPHARKRRAAIGRRLLAR